MVSVKFSSASLHQDLGSLGSGLGTALLLFSGHEIYQISGHFQDTKTMFQANILSRCGMHVIKKVEQLQVASYLSMLFHLPSTVKQHKSGRLTWAGASNP